MNSLLSWADHRVFEGPGNPIIFTVDDASLFSLTPQAHQILRKWRKSEFVELENLDAPEREVIQGLRDAQVLLPSLRTKTSAPRLEPGTAPLSTLVLEVAQDCNLRCTYCYADAGTYGAKPCLLSPETARGAVRYLLENSGEREDVTLIYFGGEPLLNMPAIRAATNEAVTYGGELGKKVSLSLTTNGTLLDAEIVKFMHHNRISVAVSMDGPPRIHDRNRPDEHGCGTYKNIVSRLEMLLKDSPVPIAARVTLEPDQWSDITEVYDHLVELGFDEVGIAPVSPVDKSLMPTEEQEAAMLRGFGQLAKRFVENAKAGLSMPFSNILDLLGRLHLGHTKPISCGAGYGYMAMDARGRFFPCHRMAGEEEYCSGSLATGVDAQKLGSCLGSLNEGREKACSRCWARTLCAGGCHYENHLRENQLGLPRGTSCRFIRSWLELGIKTYAELRESDAVTAMGPRLQERAQC